MHTVFTVLVGIGGMVVISCCHGCQCNGGWVTVMVLAVADSDCCSTVRCILLPLCRLTQQEQFDERCFTVVPVDFSLHVAEERSFHDLPFFLAFVQLGNWKKRSRSVVPMLLFGVL